MKNRISNIKSILNGALLSHKLSCTSIRDNGNQIASILFRPWLSRSTVSDWTDIYERTPHPLGSCMESGNLAKYFFCGLEAKSEAFWCQSFAIWWRQGGRLQACLFLCCNLFCSHVTWLACNDNHQTQAWSTGTRTWQVANCTCWM